jgi:hypothetical protein
VQGSVLFVERRDGQTVPIDTRRFPGVQHGYAHTEYREQGSTRYAELHLVDQHVNQRSLVVGMTRHTHRYGMLSLPRRSDRLKTSCSSTNDRVGPDSERQVDLPRAWSFDSLSGKDSATPSIRLETTVEKRSR